MTRPITAQQTIGFNEAGYGGGAYSLLLETHPGGTSLQDCAGKSYFACYPQGIATIFTSTGSAQRVSTNLSRIVEDWVSFTGSDTSNLKYPAAQNVEIMESYVKGISGNVVPVIWNQSKNALQASESLYGIVRVKYVAYYDVYQNTHFLTQDNRYIAIVVRAYAEGYSDAVGTFNAINCITNYNDGPYTHPTVKIEQDPDFSSVLVPTYYYGSNGKRVPGFPLAMSRIRVYSSGGAAVNSTNALVGGSIGVGSKEVKDALTFSGSATAGLSHPPSGGVTIHDSSLTAKQPGYFGTPGVATPGTPIVIPEWDANGSYRAKDSRILGAMEVAAVGINNVLVNSAGRAMAAYNSSFTLHDVYFTLGNDGWYQPCSIYALGNATGGATTLTPPSKRGVV